MSKSYLFVLSCGWGSRKQSINDIAISFWNVIHSLSRIDKVFLKPVMLKDNYNPIILDLTLENKDKMIQMISNSILLFSKKDIKKYEESIDPNIYYSRDFGFSWVVTYSENNKECLSFSVKMGSSVSNGIGTLTIEKDFEKDFEWFYSVLKTLVRYTYADIGGVFLKGSNFLSMINEFKRPLGWITYFTNNFEIQIPDDLKGIEYEYTEKGKYLISTRDDFTQDKETYFAHCDKLVGIMKEIKERVPGYSKG